MMRESMMKVEGLTQEFCLFDVLLVCGGIEGGIVVLNTALQRLWRSGELWHERQGEI